MSKSNDACSICFRAYTEFGDNAQPVKDGRCCNACNSRVVIPARIRAARLELENKTTEPT